MLKRLLSSLVVASFIMNPITVLASDVEASYTEDSTVEEQSIVFPEENAKKFGPFQSGVNPSRAVTPFDDKENETPVSSESPNVEYEPDSLIVKLKAKPSNDGFSLMSAANGIKLDGVSELEPLLDLTTTEAKAVFNTTENTGWFKATLMPGQTAEELLSLLSESSDVLEVEYNYIHEAAGAPDVSGNSKSTDQWYLSKINSLEAWEHLSASDSSLAGGSNDVIVAVIDTGVDYTHEDLHESMWVNPAETANNNDDDGNGFEDDIYGVTTIGNKYAGHSGNPMDDNGHGTHVAGIIAAANNNVGTVGIAYNTKIMAIKAGNASGIFTNDSIVTAINYAVANGADVINMSFGGYSRSQLVENALQLAYQHCVLVASAGNDAYPNLPHIFGRDTYPAAYPWVVGVMSMDETPNALGYHLSSFSNWDYKAEDSHEYQLMAPGSAVLSTLPGNKYGKWSGTSMAAPVVSGVAALIRSKYSDKSVYSSRFIMGQLVATGDKLFGNPYSLDYLGESDPTYHTIDAYKALTTQPKPRLTYLEHYVFDLESISDKNDENGVVDAGETVDLAVVIRNQWGTAQDVKVTLETNDPYVSWIQQTVDYGNVGSFATSDNGLTKDNEGAVNGVSNGIRFTMASNTPNDYLIEFKVKIVAYNGFTEEDKTEYVFDKQSLFIRARNGKVLPNRISTNMTLTKDTYWIIPVATLIEAKATVTIEPGTQVQFWSSQPEDVYATPQVPVLYVDGKLIAEGTADEPIEIFASPLDDSRKVEIKKRSQGVVNLKYAKIMNPVLDVSNIDHCYFTQANFDYITSLQIYSDGYYITTVSPIVNAAVISNSIFSQLGGSSRLQTSGVRKGNLFDGCAMSYNAGDDEGNVFLKNNKLIESQYGDRSIYGSQFNFNEYKNLRNWNSPKYPIKNQDNGSTYFTVSLYDNIDYSEVADFAKSMGGHIVTISDEAEYNYIQNYINEYLSNKSETITQDYPDSHYYFYYMVTGYNDFDGDGIYTWENGEIPTYNLPISPSVKGGFVTLQYGYLSERNYNEINSWGMYTIIEIPGEVDLRGLAFLEPTISIGSDDGDTRLDLIYTPSKPSGLVLNWTSSDEAVATVSNGIVTPISQGTTTITASTADGLITASCTVTIVQTVPVTDIQLSETDKRISVGEIYKVIPEFTPTNATKKQINWESSNALVAKVNEFGEITGVAAGDCVITGTLVSDDAFTVSLNVSVVKPITGISLADEFIVAEMGSDVQLEATAIPVDASDYTLLYKSSDEGVATVSPEGIVTPVSIGNAIITVYSDTNEELSTGCIVSVVDNASKVQLKGINSYSDAVSFINSEGEVYMLGRTDNYPSKFGLSAKKELSTPEKVNGISGVQKLLTNYYRSVALKDDGTVWAWGYDGWSYFGQNNSIYETSSPVQIDITDVVDIAIGDCSYLFLKNDGTVWSMGNRSNGMLGLGETERVNIPTKIDTLVNIVEISATGSTVLALDSSGILYAWGYYNSSTNYTPSVISLTETVESINYGTREGRIIKATSGSFYVFNGTLFEKITEDFTKNANEIKQILWYHNGSYMVLKHDGSLWIRNYDSYYPIPNLDNYELGRYTALENVERFAATGSAIYFLTKDGKVYAYANNDTGFNLGIGENTKKTDKPKRVLHGLNPDDVKPELVSLYPIENATDVGISEGIELKFDEAIKKGASFSMVKLYTTGESGTTIPSNIYINGKTLKIIPEEKLEYGVVYNVLVPQGSLVDVIGNVNITINYSFTTENETSLFSLFSDTTTELTDFRAMETEILEARDKFLSESYTSGFKNNAILNAWSANEPAHWMKIYGYNAIGNPSDDYSHIVGSIANNYWGTQSETILEAAIIDTNYHFNYGGVYYKPILTTAPEECYPFVSDLYILNTAGDKITSVEPGVITVVVEFNRDMDVSKELSVTFGTDVPYADYTVNGEWKDARKWEGTYTITALTTGGNQIFKIANGVAADDPWLVLGNDSERFGFSVETTGAQSMNLFASAEDDGIKLTWNQDDFDVLVGYNIYRKLDAEDENSYIRVNTHLIDKDVFEFTDTTVASGKTYNYYFTVVLSNGSESNSTSNIYTISAKDFVAPTISHTAITFAKPNAAISVFANVTDDVYVNNVTLYYRIAGETAYKAVAMVTVDDFRYSSTIPSAYVTAAGVEYYIEATDISNNLETVGTAAEPNEIAVATESDIVLGDVDEDGVVTSTDALMVLRYTVGLIKLSSFGATAADVNKDGYINSADAVLILKITVGL